MRMKRRVKNSDLRELVYSAESPIHGTGLFARRTIKKGEYIGTYHKKKKKRDGTYVLWVYDKDDEASAIGRSGRNLLRYLNHAKSGNAEFDGFDLYSTMEIEVDQEITFDYEGS